MQSCVTVPYNVCAKARLSDGAFVRAHQAWENGSAREVLSAECEDPSLSPPPM